MASIWEEAISILAVNLNLGRNYLILTVYGFFIQLRIRKKNDNFLPPTKGKVKVLWDGNELGKKSPPWFDKTAVFTQ